MTQKCWISIMRMRWDNQRKTVYLRDNLAETKKGLTEDTIKSCADLKVKKGKLKCASTQKCLWLADKSEWKVWKITDRKVFQAPVNQHCCHVQMNEWQGVTNGQILKWSMTRNVTNWGICVSREGFKEAGQDDTRPRRTDAGWWGKKHE